MIEGVKRVEGVYFGKAIEMAHELHAGEVRTRTVRSGGLKYRGPCEGHGSLLDSRNALQRHGVGVRECGA